MASTLNAAELLAVRSAIVPADPSGATIPTHGQIVTRAFVLAREVTALRPALSQLALTPAQRIGVQRGLARLSDAIGQIAAAAGLDRLGKP